MRFHWLIAVPVLFLTLSPVWAEEATKRITLTISPQQEAEVSEAYRLLPADPDLRDGNAAIEMLRIIWEQQPYMQTVVPKLSELSDLPYDDPRVAQGIHFDGFTPKLRRAAYTRNAYWDYPLDDEPLAMILLPDVQGFRDFLGRGLPMWVGIKISQGKLEEAREGILIQLACARHIARTPMLVNRLVGDSITRTALERVELLIQHEESPNLYWSLAMLPDGLADDQFLQWEAEMIPRTLDTLRDLRSRGESLPPEGDPRWKQIAAEFSDLMIGLMQGPVTPAQARVMRQKMPAEATDHLKNHLGYTDEQLAVMSDEERVMRWILGLNESIFGRMERAFALPPPLAITQLLELEAEIQDLMQRVEAPAVPFPDKPVSFYLGTRKFNRHVKQLQAIEAIRDHAAQHEGQLPKSLDEVRLHVPRDPLTEQAFEYEVGEKSAILRTPKVPGLRDELQDLREYEIVIRK